MSRLERVGAAILWTLMWIRVAGSMAAVALYFINIPMGATITWLSGLGFGLLVGLLMCGWVGLERRKRGLV